MKLLLRNSALALLLCFLVAACCKYKPKDEIPPCIKERIAKLKSGEDISSKAVYRYQYQGKTVYLFEVDEQKIIDGASEVVDDHCNFICTLGGLKGNMMCNGDDFFQKATNKKIIWMR